MNFRAYFISTMAAIAVAGCATAPSTMEFSSDTDGALLIYEFDGNSSFLVRIDTRAGTATGETIRLGNGTTVWSNAISDRLGSRQLPAGEYAVVRSFSPSGFDTYVDTCYQDAAVYFRLEAGQVAVMNRIDWFVLAPINEIDRTRLMRDTATALELYPGVTGELVPVSKAGLVRFSRSDGRELNFGNCGSGDRVEAIQ